MELVRPASVNRINQNIDASLSLESLAYIEQGVMTYVPLAMAGFHYKF
jgi:hypothetical protein